MEYDGFSSHGADYQRVLINQRLWFTNPGTSSKGTSWICPQLLGEVKVMTRLCRFVFYVFLDMFEEKWLANFCLSFCNVWPTPGMPRSKLTMLESVPEPI